MHCDVSVHRFTDPLEYGAAIRAARVTIYPATDSAFKANLTKITFPRLWMQRGFESNPRLFHTVVPADRAPILFLSTRHGSPIVHSGAEVAAGEIVLFRPDAEHHIRAPADCRWASMSLTPSELAAAGRTLAGREILAPADTRSIRPAAAEMTRLLELRASIDRLARVAPELVAAPEVARAIEHSLIHAMVNCLNTGSDNPVGHYERKHRTIMARMEEFLAANSERSVYLAELCGFINVSERTLRSCCQQHLGMGPIRYLWLRRMHFVRRKLLSATPHAMTVTKAATDFGFYELGRFSVQYQALFGELPSATLHRAPQR